MPELTRRRYAERSDCWHVYFGDVHAGTIARRNGCPVETDQREWMAGFYPGSQPGEIRSGTAETDLARSEFEAAWNVFLSNRTEPDFKAYRDQRDWTTRKYAMWERGERFSSQRPNSMMRCPCGETFDSHRLEHTLVHVPHITTAHQVDGIRR